MFAQNKDDKKKVEKALDASGFPSAKVSNSVSIHQLKVLQSSLNIYISISQFNQMHSELQVLILWYSKTCLAVIMFNTWSHLIDLKGCLNTES